MRDRFPNSVAAGAITATAVVAVVGLLDTEASAQNPTASVTTLKTPWGEPDLQGIWTAEFDLPLQRLAKYADQEFFTEAQRSELDKERSAFAFEPAQKRGTEDVGGGDRTVGLSVKHAGVRTSLIIDPPNGRLPQLTPEAEKAAVADKEFRLALLQATETCKNKVAACAGGTYDPTPSPRRAEFPPRYLARNFGPRIRADSG